MISKCIIQYLQQQQQQQQKEIKLGEGGWRDEKGKEMCVNLATWHQIPEKCLRKPLDSHRLVAEERKPNKNKWCWPHRRRLWWCYSFLVSILHDVFIPFKTVRLEKALCIKQAQAARYLTMLFPSCAESISILFYFFCERRKKETQQKYITAPPIFDGCNSAPDSLPTRHRLALKQ